MRIGNFEVRPLLLLLVFLPVAIAMELLHADPVWIFATSAIAIIPLAGLMGQSTEHLAEHMGAGLGGLLNASFGNAAELIIAMMALRAGLLDVVKASVTGSIIGNILLVLGASAVAGGIKYQRQVFNRTAATLGVTSLVLSAIGLVVPALFHIVVSDHPMPQEQELSLEIAIVLFVTYILSLVFALYTHKHLYSGESEENGGHVVREALGVESWSTKKSVTVLLVATSFVALMSEFLVGAVEHTAREIGMTEVFVGVIVVAIIGNAAEHSTAILMAMKNQMDLALNIAIGSSIQIALFVAPLLVFSGYLFGQPMNLLFSEFEVMAVALSVGIVAIVATDGESNWMEGVQLLAVYIILAIAFYFLPETAGVGAH
ncbi:MAG: calcium/proton exchanger [Deltaproteobacteria bacterium]|nr:calcium/proton exchanger [Deltaproteobacteria bacterium]